MAESEVQRLVRRARADLDRCRGAWRTEQHAEMLKLADDVGIAAARLAEIARLLAEQGGGK